MRNSRRKGTVKFAGILLSVSFVISSTWLFKENDLHKQKYKNQLYQMSAMQNIFSVNSNVHKLEDEKVLLQVSTGKNGIKERKCSECGENNMISVPQIGLKSVFTQGPFTQNAVDANDILFAYAYAFGLGENDPFILGHNTHSLKNLRNIQVGTNIYLNLNGILETYQVVVSELGQATEDQSDIRGINSGETIYRNLGVKTLHMYTCDHSVSNGRWIVLAKKIS